MESTEFKVSSCDDMSLVKAMGLTKNSDRNKARLFLAAVAVRNVYTTLLRQDVLVRKDLFAGTTPGLIKWPNISKEYSAKKWQNDFLFMLVQAGAAEEARLENGAVAYSCGNETTVKKMLIAFAHGDFDALKLLLWPTDYGAPSPKEFEEADTQVGDDDDDSATTQSSDVDVIERVADNLKGVAAHLGELYNQGATQRDDIKVLNEQLLEAVTLLTSFDERLNVVVKKLEALADDRAREERESLRDLISKIGESEARKRSLLNQLESESRKFESMARLVEEKLGNR